MNLIKKTAILGGLGFFCFTFNYALGFWYGAKLVADKVINTNTGELYNVSEIVTIFFCVYISNLNMFGINGQIRNFYNSRIAISKIVQILDRKPIKSKGTIVCPHKIETI